MKKKYTKKRGRKLQALLISWFYDLDRIIFNESLKYDAEITVVHSCENDAKAWYCDGQIQIAYTGDTYDAFITLAHEMIHHAQDCAGTENLNHGGAFFRHYARKFCNKFGVPYKFFTQSKGEMK